MQKTDFPDTLTRQCVALLGRCNPTLCRIAQPGVWGAGGDAAAAADSKVTAEAAGNGGAIMSAPEEPISLAKANQIANELTRGEVSVVSDGFSPVLVRKGYVVTFPLHAVELTEACLRERLANWNEWPK